MTRKRMEIAQSALLRRLADLHAALDRIERGTYGVCTRCERPIGDTALVGDPSRARCRSCEPDTPTLQLRLVG